MLQLGKVQVCGGMLVVLRMRQLLYELTMDGRQTPVIFSDVSIIKELK